VRALLPPRCMDAQPHSGVAVCCGMLQCAAVCDVVCVRAVLLLRAWMPLLALVLQCAALCCGFLQCVLQCV